MPYSTKENLNRLTHDIIGAAIQVHRLLGPGLLESIYHECLKIELEDRDIDFSTELNIPITFNGRKLETTLRCDLYVCKSIVVELKSVSEILPIHEAQLLTYMKLLKAPKGILINFNCFNLFREGQKTFVTEQFRILPDK